MLGQIAAARAIEPAQFALDHAPQPALIQMPPPLDAVILDLQPAGAAARTDRPLAAQTDRHDHRLLAELHVPDPRARKREHLLNAVLTRTSSSFAANSTNQQPPGASAAGRPARAQLASPRRPANVNDVAEPRAARQAAAPGDLSVPRTPAVCRQFGRLTRASAPLFGTRCRQGRHRTRQRPRPPRTPIHPQMTRSPDIWGRTGVHRRCADPPRVGLVLFCVNKATY